MLKFFEKLKKILFPNDMKCDICGKEMPSGKSKVICDECMKKLPFIFHGCIKCGEKIDGEYDVCYSCKQNFREFDKNYSVFEYCGIAKEMVWNIKYENKKYLAKTMASFLADKVVFENIKFDLLTCVPTTKTNIKKRGYNQAMLIAENLAKLLCAKADFSILYRVKENTSQVSLSAQERQKNIENSFIVQNKKEVKGKTILVIDDVLTTGATMNECAKMLKKAGAKSVIGLTFANTTRKPKFEKENQQIPTKSEN